MGTAASGFTGNRQQQPIETTQRVLVSEKGREADGLEGRKNWGSDRLASCQNWENAELTGWKGSEKTGRPAPEGRGSCIALPLRRPNFSRG